MNHTYFLVTLDVNGKKQTLWELETERLWKKFKPDHSLLKDPERLILTDEELGSFIQCDRHAVMVEELDPSLSSKLWWEYGDDEGGPARLTQRFLLDKNTGGEWQVIEASQ